MQEGFDVVSSIVGNAMDNAWKEIIGNLAKAATGEVSIDDIQPLAISGLKVNSEHLQDFFSKAGGAQMSLYFPSVLPRIPVEVVRTANIVHGVASVLGENSLHTAGADLSISISGCVRF